MLVWGGFSSRSFSCRPFLVGGGSAVVAVFVSGVLLPSDLLLLRGIEKKTMGVECVGYRRELPFL